MGIFIQTPMLFIHTFMIVLALSSCAKMERAFSPKLTPAYDSTPIPITGPSKITENDLLIENVQDLDRVEEFAKKGNDQAAVRVAEFYLFGPEAYRDTDKALIYLNKAYMRGNLEAIEIMAGVYLHGRGISDDPKRAERLYTICARQGYGPCQFNLGIIYKNGYKSAYDNAPVLQNPEKSYYWLFKASTNPGLGPLTYDAATYRNEVVPQLRQEIRENIRKRVLYENERDGISMLGADLS